jgi:4a-hydroxytetrahydrobiopterin dehydratase
MKEPVLDEETVTTALEPGNGLKWHLMGGKLVKSVVCDGFVGAVAYVGEVAKLAEEANHHPDIDIRYDRVTLALITHDSGGITRLDLDLAEAIDGITKGLPPER